MKTINATEYNAYDSKHRVPNAKVYVKRNYDSIPFEGKSLHTSTASERYPKHILHSDGRLCLVFSKYNSTNSEWDLYFKSTNTARTIWNTSVEVASDAAYSYNNPAITEVGSNNLGIIVSRDGTDLYSCVVNTSGTIQTALADTTINGATPSLTKVGSTYWLTYSRTGVLYYRTSTDFVTWGAENNFNTITGLTNNHYNPYIYYDTSSKLWLAFERVTDATANPVVKNIYTMISSDDGSTWDSPVQQTTLTAGDGSCVIPSLIDTTSHRYLSYTFQRQIQNLDFNSGNYTMYDQVYDSTNNRVIFVASALDGSYYDGVTIYDIDTGTYTTYDSQTYADLSGARHVSYDEDNQIIVIGTNSNGVVTYNESTTTWTTYDTGTTPAISDNKIYAVKIEDKKIYVVCSSSATVYQEVINIDSGSVTTLSPNLNTTAGSPEHAQIFLESNRILIVINTAYSGYSPPKRKQISYFNKTSLTNLFVETTVGDTTYRPYQGSASLPQKVMGDGYDSTNRIIYFPGEDTSATHDYGILTYNITDTGISLNAYWSNAVVNSVGLLPNPDQAGGTYIYVTDMHHNPDTGRLYIFQCTQANGNNNESYLTVVNTNTSTALEYYSVISATAYSANFPSIYSDMYKILTNYASTGTRYISSDDSKRLYFYGINQTYHHILYTESSEQRVYYRRTSDDSSWDAQAYLTTDTQDTYCNLGFSDARLKAFWDRLSDGTYELKWDEDLSSEIEITQYVESVERDMTIENEANKCSVALSDTNGLFNPINYASLYHDYLNENNIIRIEKGNDTNYESYFYGLIGSGDATYIRGEGIFYNITVWDKSKNYYSNKVTTGLYEDKTVAYIFEDIATNYMNLTASEYTAPSITTIIPQVQFIEETPMDVLNKILQIDNYYADFDEEGVLVAKEINYEASTDFTYYDDGTDTVSASQAPAMNINSINFSWDDNQLINKVTVIGQEEATGEETFAEEFMGTISGVAGWFSKRNQFEFYYSNDKKLYCKYPRLDVKDSCGNKFFGGGESMTVDGGDTSVKKVRCIVNQAVSNLIASIFALIAAAQVWLILQGTGAFSVWVYNGLALVVSLGYTFLGQIGSFYYEIYARPVGEAIPDTIAVSASDTDLIEKYNGTNELEIDNPLLSTQPICNALAENELEKAKWFRYNIILNVNANMAIQTGDVISLYNPTFNSTHKIYVREISSTYRRGEVDMDEIVGALIT